MTRVRIGLLLSVILGSIYAAGSSITSRAGSSADVMVGLAVVGVAVLVYMAIEWLGG